jgi:hypothetical protein
VEETLAPGASVARVAPDNSSNHYQYDTLNRLGTPTNSLTGQFSFGLRRAEPENAADAATSSFH